jgi:hypothetical protein
MATRAGHADISVRHQRPRDLAGYGMLQLVVQLPIVFLAAVFAVDPVRVAP